MKHTKRISLLTTFLLASVILLPLFYTEAETETGYIQADFSVDNTENWLKYESANTQIVESDFNNNKALGLKTNSTKNAIRVASPKFVANSSEDGVFYISYNFMVNQTSDSGFFPERYLKLINSDNLNSTPTVSINLTKVKDSGLYIGSNTASLATISNGTAYSMKLKVDTASSTVEAWLNSTKITSTPVSFNKPSSMDYSKCRMMFNIQSTKVGTQSEFYIYDVTATSSTVLNVSTSPKDGDVVSAADTNKVSVDLGVIPFGNYSVQMYKTKTNESEELVDANVLEKGSMIYIGPKSAIEEMCSYRVTIAGLQNSSGESFDQIDINFDTAFEGYSKPSVSITNQVKAGKVGQSILLETEAESACGTIDKVELYINNSLLLGNVWIPNESGEYEIYAIAYDNYGGSSKSETVTFDISYNELPNISFNLNDKTSPDELKDFTVYTEDTDGIVINVKVYLDGKRVAEKSTSSEYIFDLSDCNLGKHLICVQATDDSGAVSKLEKTTTVVVIEEKNDISYDFENYVTTNPMGGKTNGGTFNSANVDEQHGISLGISVDNSTPDGWGGPYVGVSTTATKDAVAVKFDFCLTNASMRIHFETRGEASGETTNDFDISGGYLTVNGGTAVSLSANKWYGAEYTFYPQEHKFDFALDDGETFLCQYMGLSSKTDKVQKFSTFRIYVDGKTANKETVYLDNVSLMRKSVYPYIKKVYSESMSEGVKYTDKNLFIEFSDQVIVPEELEITLENETGSIPIDKVETLEDNLLKIIPRYDLDSASRYVVVIGKDLLRGNGNPIGEKTEAAFVTTPKQFDVTEGGFSDTSMLYFTTKIDNETAQDEEITVIMIVYKNGVFDKVLSEKRTVHANETLQISTPTIQNEAGITAKGFAIYDDNRYPISNKIYQYN